MPKKTPLHAHVFGKIERDGYTIEKVFFASYPGHYVSGNLYRPTGKTAPMRFLFDELGTIDGRQPRAARLAQLAQALVGRANGRLSRTIVNRLWARLMGRGLVEPVDDMDQAAWRCSAWSAAC